MFRVLFLLLATLPAVSANAASKIIPKSGQIVDNKSFYSGYRLYDDMSGLATGLIISRVMAVQERAAVRIGGDAHDIVIRDSDFSLKAPQSGSNLPVGIDLRGTVHDVLILRVKAHGFQMLSVADKYTNGDGFSTERGVNNVMYRDTEASDNSDGGYDLKGTGLILDRVRSLRNKRNFRFWGTGSGTTVTSVDAKDAHIWLHGPGTVWHITELRVNSATTAPIVASENAGASLRIDRCILNVPSGTPLLRGNATLTVGPGCKP